MNANDPVLEISLPAVDAGEPEPSSEQPKADAKGKPDNTNTEDQGSAYWRQQYEQMKAERDQAARYSGIISALETDPDLVSVLEQHIAGEIVDNRNSLFADDDDDEISDPTPTAPKGSAKGQSDLEDAEKRGEERGRQIAEAQAELRSFIRNMLETGAPDHVMHEFVNFVNNPSGMTVADLYAAFDSMKARDTNKEGEAEPAPAKKKDGPSGLPVAAVTGTTDRPVKETKQTLDGVHYVPDANAIW